MSIRPATPADQIRMSQLAATAFFDDELFGDWIHPNRNQYPEDVHLYWLKRLRKGWDLPFNHFLVTTVQDPEEGEVVTGMAQWMRKGEGGAGAPGMEEVEKKRGEEVEAELEREGLRNRAADPKMEDCLERGYPFIAHHWKGKRRECYDLTWLAVDPHYQGHGHGAKLVKWGLDRADAENVAVSIISAEGKERFYEKCGMTRIDARAGDGEGNPLAGQGGGQFFFRDARVST